MPTNKPTDAGWQNPYWGSTPQWLRPILEHLANFLARPTFYNGIALGDSTTVPDQDPVTGVRTLPVVRVVDAKTISDLEARVAFLEGRDHIH